MEYYDRYQSFRKNGQVDIMPFIKIENGNEDITILYDKSKMRMDNLSYKYYGDSNFAWLIMMANAKYGSMEFEIPDGIYLRIPYPLSTAISRYENAVNNVKR